MKDVTLNNGVVMPMIGLGTFPMHRWELVRAVYYAKRIGYRNFDTAWKYGNERALNWAMKFSMMNRKEYFLTSKIEWVQKQQGSVRKALTGTLQRLGTNYLDLYLIHWPKSGYYIDMWKEMEELYQEGLIRAIGVSNFLQPHLERLLAECSMIPAVNQIELNPLNTQKTLISFCKDQGIQMMAHTPLAKGSPLLFNNEILKDIASHHHKSVAQIVLRWIIQQNIIICPKSSHKENLKSNIDIFDFLLSEEECAILDTLNQDLYFYNDPHTTL